jgi:hypothetical protein
VLLYWYECRGLLLLVLVDSLADALVLVVGLVTTKDSTSIFVVFHKGDSINKSGKTILPVDDDEAIMMQHKQSDEYKRYFLLLLRKQWGDRVIVGCCVSVSSYVICDASNGGAAKNEVRSLKETSRTRTHARYFRGPSRARDLPLKRRPALSGCHQSVRRR